MDQAIEGIGPLPAASDLADRYRGGDLYPDNAARVRALIEWACARNAATGFVGGLGGALTLPVAISGSFAASLAIQASMVAAIAELHGRSSQDDQVRTMILMCVLSNGLMNPVKKAGIASGEKIAIGLLRRLPGAVLIEINKKVSFRALTKFEERCIVNLARVVPLAGGVIGGAVDATSCWAAGRAATRLLPPTAPNAA